MDKKIESIWIESEENGPINGGNKFTNDNSDVIVTFNDGTRYWALFITYENIEWLRQKNQKTGECLNGKYLPAHNMLIIDRVDRESITQVIEELIQNNCFADSFSLLE